MMSLGDVNQIPRTGPRSQVPQQAVGAPHFPGVKNSETFILRSKCIMISNNKNRRRHDMKQHHYLRSHLIMKNCRRGDLGVQSWEFDIAIGCHVDDSHTKASRDGVVRASCRLPMN